MTTPIYDNVAYLASDKFAVFNAAGDSFTSEFAPGLRLRADCGTDGVLLGTVATVSHDGATGRTVVTTAMDDGAALTANLVEVLHGNDLPASLCAHAALHALGGRDALPGATTGVSGLVSLASTAETQAGTSAAKAVTPAGLAASAKGLIATNTTIYVATTGSDATGTGASSAPYASITKALSSIANKLIASGATVTIQVADGTYTISRSIVIDHPDADKIQILGNTSTETTAPIVSIDTAAKTIIVAGDSMGSIQAGDIIGLTGSSTAGLNGAYVVSGVSYSSGNTVISCSAEIFASGTVGGGSIIIKPCNRCVLNLSGPSVLLDIRKTFKFFNGFRLNSSENTGYAAKSSVGACCFIGDNIIVRGFNFAVYAAENSYMLYGAITFKDCAYGMAATQAKIWPYMPLVVIFDGCEIAMWAYFGSYCFIGSYGIYRNVTITTTPVQYTTGNSNSYIG